MWPFHLIFLLSLVNTQLVTAQDIPLYNQKLTNAFLYNPALAGIGHASLTYAYLKNYSNVINSPQSMLLGYQMPFQDARFGAGILLHNDQVNFIRNSIVSMAFAYHLKIKKQTTLSSGISGEYDRIGLIGDANFSGSGTDPVLQTLRLGSQSRHDFSFGMHFQNPFLQMGISINRLRTSLTTLAEPKLLTGYYSFYMQRTFSLRNNADKVQPFIAIRQLSNTNRFVDFGVYYTANNKIILGMSYKTLGAFSFHIAFYTQRQFMMAYSRETYSNDVGNVLGSTSEIDMKYDFEHPKNRRYICYGIPEVKKIKPKSVNARTPFRKRRIK
jgi:type IX secretion system PorP/SprF family membrane protein